MAGGKTFSPPAAVFSITDTSVPADKTLVDQTALIVREDNILKFTEVNCQLGEGMSEYQIPPFLRPP